MFKRKFLTVEEKNIKKNMFKASAKYLGFLILSAFVFTNQELKAQTKPVITLSNTSAINLIDKAVSIPRSKISKIPKSANCYPLIVSLKGDTIASQLDDLDGDKLWDELFFVVDLAPKETARYHLSWVSAKPNYTIRTSVRFGKRESAHELVKPALSEVVRANDMPKKLGFQKYQTDGPSWENDKVGFRHYLDGRNAKDVFGKKTAEMSPENVGINAKGAVEDNYHVMENWGRDIMAVGNSTGLGGYGLMAKNQLFRLGVTAKDSVNNVKETTFKIATEGSVRSILNFKYKQWKPTDRNYTVEEHTTIWPGMYAYGNSVKFSGLRGDENLVVGLVNINTETPISVITENDKYVVLYTHDKQTYNKEWWLGLALIIPKNIYIAYTEAPKKGQLTNTFLAKLKVENNKWANYYAVACWELSDERFIDRQFFVDYLKNLTAQLSAKVDLSINLIKE